MRFRSDKGSDERGAARREEPEDAVDRLLSNPAAFDDLELGPGEEPGVCLFCMTPTAYKTLPDGDLFWKCGACGRSSHE